MWRKILKEFLSSLKLLCYFSMANAASVALMSLTEPLVEKGMSRNIETIFIFFAVYDMVITMYSLSEGRSKEKDNERKEVRRGADAGGSNRGTPADS